MASTNPAAQSAAQLSLSLLEEQFIHLPDYEQEEIEAARQVLRELVQKYGASAKLAILAIGFEIAITERQ